MQCNISGKSFLETLATTRESLNMHTAEIAEFGGNAPFADRSSQCGSNMRE